MTTIKTVKTSAPVSNAKPASAAPATVAAKPTVSRDSLQVTRPASNNPGTEALRVLTEASQLPPMPRDAAGQRAWLTDGFTRTLKMTAAEETMRQAWRDGKITGTDLSVAKSRIWAVQRELAKAPGYEAAKKEFFGGVIAQANGMIDGLANYPAAPADKAGKQAWMAAAKVELAKAKEAEKIMKACWFDHQVLPFEALSAASKKVWDFEGQIRRVDFELNPPAPRQPRQPGQPGSANPGRPLFELTQQAQRGLDSNNPIGQTAGAIVLPIALTIDLIDMLTRPLQWLESTQRVEVKKVDVKVSGGQVRIK